MQPTDPPTLVDCVRTTELLTCRYRLRLLARLEMLLREIVTLDSRKKA